MASTSFNGSSRGGNLFKVSLYYECFVICVMSAVGTKFSVMILLKIFLFKKSLISLVSLA